jgi:tRNA threonylcarbamoyladenosine biosynthesis protein TsaB
MAPILCIDTAGAVGRVGFALDGAMVAELTNPLPMEHAAFLQPAVDVLAKQLGIDLSTIAAVAVSNGPGSYTGLRVGLASAKGICFALGKPMITLNTLKIMAKTASHAEHFDPAHLICPMIDARRLEVFFAVYNAALQECLPTQTAIIGPEFLADILAKQTVVFLGSGAQKWHAVCVHPHATFVPEPTSTGDAMAYLAQMAFEQKDFANTAYAEPFYAKDFYTTAKANNTATPPENRDMAADEV